MSSYNKTAAESDAKGSKMDVRADVTTFARWRRDIAGLPYNTTLARLVLLHLLLFLLITPTVFLNLQLNDSDNNDGAQQQPVSSSFAEGAPAPEAEAAAPPSEPEPSPSIYPEASQSSTTAPPSEEPAAPAEEPGAATVAATASATVAATASATAAAAASAEHEAATDVTDATTNNASAAPYLEAEPPALEAEAEAEAEVAAAEAEAEATAAAYPEAEAPAPAPEAEAEAKAKVATAEAEAEAAAAASAAPVSEGEGSLSGSVCRAEGVETEMGTIMLGYHCDLRRVDFTAVGARAGYHLTLAAAAVGAVLAARHLASITPLSNTSVRRASIRSSRSPSGLMSTTAVKVTNNKKLLVVLVWGIAWSLLAASLVGRCRLNAA